MAEDLFDLLNNDPQYINAHTYVRIYSFTYMNIDIRIYKYRHELICIYINLLFIGIYG
jgi:hypothetical protein